MKKLIIALLAVLCLTAAAMSQALKSVTLLTQQQALDIARTWLNQPAWAPTETTQNDYNCLCEQHIVHSFTMSQGDDIVVVDRTDGHVRAWDHFNNSSDTLDDPAAIRSIYQKWAPTHLPSGMMSRLTEMPGCVGWMYRQANDIAHTDYRVNLKIDRSGVVVGGVVKNCILPDYTGSVISSSQAQSTAYTWLSSVYADSSCSLAWPYGEPVVLHGQPTQSGIGLIPMYQMVCKQTIPNEGDFEFLVVVNAATGEVWDESDLVGSYHQLKAKKGSLLVVTVDRKISMGYPNSLMSLKSLQALAKGHKLSAKAGEKAFTLDGKRIALPSKVVSKAGTLYLPWQSLKSLPGIKCSYDAKLNRLDITTAKAAAKPKTAASPK